MGWESKLTRVHLPVHQPLSLVILFSSIRFSRCYRLKLFKLLFKVWISINQRDNLLPQQTNQPTNPPPCTNFTQFTIHSLPLHYPHFLSRMIRVWINVSIYLFMSHCCQSRTRTINSMLLSVTSSFFIDKQNMLSHFMLSCSRCKYPFWTE